MNTYNCIIVDDNLIDRLLIRSFAEEFEELNIISDYSNPISCANEIDKNVIDILFLDIDMPEMSGFDFRKKFKDIPVCIFVTSHPEFAVESYELDALDFIVKPVSKDRFKTMINRVMEYMKMRSNATLFEKNQTSEEFYIKTGNKKIKILPDEITYLEAFKDYTKIVTTQDTFYTLGTFNSVLEDNNFSDFIRVHRSFAVPKKSIQFVQSQQIILDNGVAIPIGRKYKSQIEV